MQAALDPPSAAPTPPPSPRTARRAPWKRIAVAAVAVLGVGAFVVPNGALARTGPSDSGKFSGSVSPKNVGASCGPGATSGPSLTAVTLKVRSGGKGRMRDSDRIRVTVPGVTTVVLNRANNWTSTLPAGTSLPCGARLRVNFVPVDDGRSTSSQLRVVRCASALETYACYAAAPT